MASRFPKILQSTRNIFHQDLCLKIKILQELLYKILRQNKNLRFFVAQCLKFMNPSVRVERIEFLIENSRKLIFLKNIFYFNYCDVYKIHRGVLNIAMLKNKIAATIFRFQKSHNSNATHISDIELFFAFTSCGDQTSTHKQILV